MDIEQKGRVLITCARELGQWLSQELRQLNYNPIEERTNGVEIDANWYDIMNLNLQLRTAFCVLFRLKKFKCTNPHQFYKNINEIDWENWIPSDGYVSVVTRANHPSIKNSMFANQRAKDAIVDRIKEKTGQRPDSGPIKNRAVVNVYWHKSDCWVYINTTGNKLSDRGYRKMPHSAPLQETLAAAILMAAEYDTNKPIVLPMCGSGTLAIEAALMALNKAPGLLRSNYSFMHLINYDKQAWQEIRQNTLSLSKKELSKPIIASDIDSDAIQASLQNACTAGVDHLVRFNTCDFAQTEIPDEPGIVLMNPEYGERLGDIKDLEKLYNGIGDFFKQQCKGYNGYIFTGNLDLAKKVGLKASKRMIFYNASIECRLLKYEIYAGSRKSKNAQPK